MSPSGYRLMPLRIELLDIQENQVHKPEQFLDIRIPHAAVGIQTDMYSIILQHFDKRYQCFRLRRRFSAGKRHPASFAEKRLLVQRHAQDFLRSGRCSSFKCYRIGIRTIQTTEGAALKENDEPETRPVVSPH